METIPFGSEWRFTRVHRTETALLGTSLDRPQGDNAWAYIRPSPGLLRHIWPKPLGEEMFEFVYLKEYPSLVTSNSAEPPGSFHSKDIFSPHPNIKDAWKHAGRIDDRITLMNGEKVLPLSMEGRVQEHQLVKTAVVFGISKPIPGLLVFRAEAANSIPDDEFITIIQPTIEAANSAAEGFAEIGHDMIVPMAAGVEIPMTDKRSIIRAQIYQNFALEITNAYDKADGIQENGLRLDLPALEQYLLSATESVIGVRLSNTNVDFFRAGIDSLQAIQLRTKICKDLYLGSNGKKISHNVVFETGTVKTLARYLYGLSHDEDIEEEDQVKVMTQMVEKYSQFKERTPDSNIGLELRPSVSFSGI